MRPRTGCFAPDISEALPRIFSVAAAAVFVILATGCSNEPVSPSSQSSTEPTPTPTVNYPSSLTVTVDCGEDGVAGVTVDYGTAPTQNVLVGRSPVTVAAGGQRIFSSNYGTQPGLADATLQVTTEPTRGICTTTFTDYDSGNVLLERESAGRVMLTGIVEAS
jgi:hypothetical protein